MKLSFFAFPSFIILLSYALRETLTNINEFNSWQHMLLLLDTLLAFTWLGFASLLNRLIRVFLWENLGRKILQRSPPQLLIQLGNFIVYLIVISLIISHVYEKSVGSFWAASGALGVVVGLALRNLIMDTFSGLALQMERPFKVGDWIRVYTRMGEFTGRVEDTNWRATRLWKTDRSVIVIPNSTITTTVMENLNGEDQVGRFELMFELDYKVPTEKAIRVLNAALIESIGDKGPLASPAPKVRLDSIGEYGMTYLARYYLDPNKVSPSKARHTIYVNTCEHLKGAGLTLAFPKYDIFTARMPWRQQDWDYNKDRARLLAYIDLFKYLEPYELEFIANRAELLELKPNRNVIVQGEKGDSMYVVSEGLLDVYVEFPDTEKPVNVARLSPGAFFGEKSLLTGEPRSATIVSATPVVMCRISSECMRELIVAKPKLAETVSEAVALRDIHNREHYEELSLQERKKLVADEAASFLNRMKQFFSFS